MATRQRIPLGPMAGSRVRTEACIFLLLILLHLDTILDNCSKG